MDDKSKEFLESTGGDAREAPTQPSQTAEAERAAFEAWYANRHPKPVHENATWAHASKVDDWEVWQARAALSSRPVQGGESAEKLQALLEIAVKTAEAAQARADRLQSALSSAPAREPMTDEQAEQIRLEVGFAGGASRFVEFARAIERHHGITKE